MMVINNKNISNIVRESIRKIVNNELINPITEESEFLENPPFIIEEGLIKTYPIDKSISAFANVYKLEIADNKKDAHKMLFDKIKNNIDFNGIICKESSLNDTERIIMLLGNSEYNKNIAVHYMDKYGYVLSNEQDYYSGWKMFTFEKKFDNDATEIVRKAGALYHISKMSLKNKILKNGLTPHNSKWKTFNNGPRCYFFLPLSKEQLEKWIMNFRLKKGDLNEKYFIMKIDANKLNGIKFYLDPRMNNAVYSLEGIPPKAIEIIEENLNGKL